MGISIHALREEGDHEHVNAYGKWGTKKISIHALREEGDALVSCHTIPPNISIHALREEGDDLTGLLQLLHGDFYPRPPRGGRQDGAITGFDDFVISIHALREEGDC